MPRTSSGRSTKGRSTQGLRARELMEPLRVAAGATETIAELARRLRTHQATGAPVVLRGAPLGLLTRAQTEAALRHGAGGMRAADLVCGGVARVDPAADPRCLSRAARGTAPGLLVGRPGGPLMGFLGRDRIELVARLSEGGELRGEIASAFGREGKAFLNSAGKVARTRGVGVYLVGGVVRDLLLGRASGDVDLVVEGDGIAFAAELADLLGGRFTRHATFGTAAVILFPAGKAAGAKVEIDVATARRETYDRPAALPRVAPGTLLDDLLRRDVTINSMAVRLDGRDHGRLLDGLGGQRDLRRRVLRVHHKLSLVEDPTRAWRIARFAARFGFTPSPETLSGLELAFRLGAFEALGGERLYREFGLIRTEPSPASAIAWCARLGLLAHLGPAVRWDAGVRRSVTRLYEGLRSGLLDPRTRPARVVLMTLILLALEARGTQRDALAARLRITGEAADSLRSSAEKYRELLRALTSATRPSRIVRLCESAPPEVPAIVWAAGPPPAAQAVRLYLRKLRRVQPSVTGGTLRSMGLAPGPRYGTILSRLKEAILDGRVRDEAEERRLALRLIQDKSRR